MSNQLHDSSYNLNALHQTTREKENSLIKELNNARNHLTYLGYINDKPTFVLVTNKDETKSQEETGKCTNLNENKKIKLLENELSKWKKKYTEFHKEN